jgi:DNA-binding transcriptional ArsR family regulator
MVLDVNKGLELKLNLEDDAAQRILSLNELELGIYGYLMNLKFNDNEVNLFSRDELYKTYLSLVKVENQENFNKKLDQNNFNESVNKLINEGFVIENFQKLSIDNSKYEGQNLASLLFRFSLNLRIKYSEIVNSHEYDGFHKNDRLNTFILLSIYSDKSIVSDQLGIEQKEIDIHIKVLEENGLIKKDQNIYQITTNGKEFINKILKPIYNYVNGKENKSLQLRESHFGTFKNLNYGKNTIID